MNNKKAYSKAKYSSNKHQDYDRFGFHHNEFDNFVSKAFGDDFFESGFGDFGYPSIGNRLSSFGHNRFELEQENDPFGSNIFNNIMRFDSNISKGNKNGTVISKSYVSSMQYDKNGNPIKKEFQSQSIDQYDKDGTKISEKRHEYRDSEKGIKQASHQRMLNDHGHKIVKTKDYKKNEENESHYYKGMNENESEGFHKRFNDISDRVDFKKNYQLLDNNNNNNKQRIGNKENHKESKLKLGINNKN
jgi:hypothetical protein